MYRILRLFQGEHRRSPVFTTSDEAVEKTTDWHSDGDQDNTTDRARCSPRTLFAWVPCILCIACLFALPLFGALGTQVYAWANCTYSFCDYVDLYCPDPLYTLPCFGYGLITLTLLLVSVAFLRCLLFLVFGGSCHPAGRERQSE